MTFSAENDTTASALSAILCDTYIDFPQSANSGKSIKLFYGAKVTADCRIPELMKVRVGHVALKSASPQVFLVAPQRKLRFSKAQLRSLRFKLLDVTFNRNFYDWIWYGETSLDRLL